MCGIAGIVSFNKQIKLGKIQQMTDLIQHRGPDDEGFMFIDSKTGKYSDDQSNPEEHDIALGFRRLAIIDLTKDGHQPFVDAESGAVIVFNGEIYNYIELRQELMGLGYKFYSKTDTEVLLKSYLAWGVSCLDKFNGMWSFAIWDNKNKSLFCARDRFGIKPFYYAKVNDTFIFGSEIKQILLHIERPRTGLIALQRFLFLNAVQWHDGTTMIDDVYHLPPGHFLVVKNDQFQISKYYKPSFLHPDYTVFKGSFEDAKYQYLHLFKDAVKLRLRSDAPLGSALSGGLDSSAIVAFAAQEYPGEFKTFTAFFDELNHQNEKKWAQLACERSGAIGHYLSPKVDEVATVIDEIIWHQDIPLTSSSLVAQYFVMKTARENHITVMLDGQGADEILAGYGNGIFNHYADLLAGFRFSGIISSVNKYAKENNKNHSWIKLAVALLLSVEKQKCLEFKLGARKLNQKPDCSDILDNLPFFSGSKLKKSLLYDLFHFSIPNLLHYEDRNSMAHSIEARVPFLDYRLVEFSFSLPDHFKINQAEGKYIHRQSLASLVPHEILTRKDKVAFKAPGEDIWLRKNWKDELLKVTENHKLSEYGIIPKDILKTNVHKYLNGDNSVSSIVWKLYMTDLWMRRFSLQI